MKHLVDKAVQGDSAALVALITEVYEKIHTFALRLLYHRQDAEDAAQEISIKIITRLCTFENRSSFTTWAMAIAANHLKTMQGRITRQAFTFSGCQDIIVRNAPDPSSLGNAGPEQEMQIKEMRIVCVLGLFQCLDWDLRIAYILGEVMDVSGPEGGRILDIPAATFRKRLSRARQQVRRFLSANCELFDSGNPCKCLNQARAMEKMKGRYPNFLSPDTRTEAAAKLEDLDRLARQTVLMRMAPESAMPGETVRRLKEIMDSRTFQNLKTFN